MELVQGGGGEVRQSEVIAALSHALDMTEGHPVDQACVEALAAGVESAAERFAA